MLFVIHLNKIIESPSPPSKSILIATLQSHYFAIIRLESLISDIYLNISQNNFNKNYTNITYTVSINCQEEE